jgi:EAL domain-containing protein (putative c-di-GMP-specific phosphodiesterase class I)
MIAYVDRDECCRYYNPAFGRWIRHRGDALKDRHLRDVVGTEIYVELTPGITEALGGRKTSCDVAWREASGEITDCTITLLPFPPDAERPAGFYMLIARNAATANVPTPASVEAVADVLAVSNASGETLYLKSMTEQLISGSDPRGQLVRALQKDEFILFAQKIQPLAPRADQREILEVLLRLQEEEENMLPPGGFFPIAERYDLMEEIDRWVLRNLLKWCAARRRDDSTWRMPLCCVNICGATLHDAGFPLYVEAELERYRVPADTLCFEIAEPDLLDHYRAVHTLMHALKPRGCRFTADAFGSVKVSFASFRELKFDFVKIDGSIVQNIVRERADFAKTRAIALACQYLGVLTIAEFVESEDTLARLREIGIDYAQGFGISLPGPID